MHFTTYVCKPEIQSFALHLLFSKFKLASSLGHIGGFSGNSFKPFLLKSKFNTPSADALRKRSLHNTVIDLGELDEKSSIKVGLLM